MNYYHTDSYVYSDQTYRYVLAFKYQLEIRLSEDSSIRRLVFSGEYFIRRFIIRRLVYPDTRLLMYSFIGRFLYPEYHSSEDSLIRRLFYPETCLSGLAWVLSLVLRNNYFIQTFLFSANFSWILYALCNINILTACSSKLFREWKGQRPITTPTLMYILTKLIGTVLGMWVSIRDSIIRRLVYLEIWFSRDSFIHRLCYTEACLPVDSFTRRLVYLETR